MAKKRFVFKTKPRNGSYVHIIIEDHKEKGFMGQLSRCASCPDPNDLHSETIILDHFPTLELACEAVNYPYDVVGLPVLK